MKKTIAILLVAIMAVGSVFAAFSGEASLGFGGNFDNGNFGFIDSAAKVTIDADLATASAEQIADGDIYAAIKATFGLKLTTGEETRPEVEDPAVPGAPDTTFGSNYKIGIIADITEAKIAGQNWEVSILGLDDAPNYAKGFQTYTVEDGIDKWGLSRADFDENYNTELSFEKATGIQATVFGFKAGFGLLGDYDDVDTWELKDNIRLAALFETPEFDFNGFKLQAGAAYSYAGFNELDENKHPTHETLDDPDWTKTNALSVSAKAGYATDALSVMAATDVGFKFVENEDTTVDADVTVDVAYDFLTVNAYYGTNPVTGKDPVKNECDKYTKTRSEDMLSAQVKFDLNSFSVPVALTVGMNDIIAKQAIVAKAEVTPIDGLKLTVNGGYTIDEKYGRDDDGKILKDEKGKDIVGKWSAGVDAEYDMDIVKVTAGISAEQLVEKDAKVKLGLNAAVESSTIIPGATIKLAWADAEDILKAENDGAKELGKITASIKMTF